MVAKISTGKSIIGLVNYNEQKVTKGDARLIFAQNMVLGKSAEELTYAMKIGTFERILDGKKNYKLDKTTFHVSLNFDPTEKPHDDTLKEIARLYMEKMGYGNQPFLVYRHEDTHHPHIHIVSIKVDRNGKKIDDSFYKRKSEETRKELEVSFGLVKASEKLKSSIGTVQALDPTRIDYGKSETKAAIRNVVDQVMDQYRFTNLKEFQTLLSQFNVKVERTTGETKKGKYEGLVYSICDASGNRAGVGIKASSLYRKPTMANLEPLFEQNKILKPQLAKATAKSIEKVLKNHASIRQDDFERLLAEKGIVILYHHGKQGVYGVSFIDNAQKAVYKGSELGKTFSWNVLRKAFSEETKVLQPVNQTKLESADLKRITSSLATIYGHLKKDPQSGAYFESVFVRSLDQVDLVTPLVKLYPNLDTRLAHHLSDQYKEFKRSRLPQIEAKEKAYFESQLQLRFQFLLQPSKATLQERLDYFHRNHIGVSLQKDQVTFSHTQGNHIHVSFPIESVKQVLGISAAQFPLETVQLATDEKVRSKATLADALGSTGDNGGIESHHRKNKKRKRGPGFY